MTASSAEGDSQTIEAYQAGASMGRAWSDYAFVTIKEVSYIKCEEALCMVNYVIHAVPPGDGTGNTAPFDNNGSSWVRLVDGVWLEDRSKETHRSGFQSTHRD